MLFNRRNVIVWCNPDYELEYDIHFFNKKEKKKENCCEDFMFCWKWNGILYV